MGKVIHIQGGYELTTHLYDENELYRFVGELYVNPMPHRFVDMGDVVYEFMAAIHDGKARLLERRIETVDREQVVTERLIDVG